VASSEIILTKDNTTFSFITQNSGCTVANLPEAKYAIDLNIIDCLTHSIDDSIYLEVDTTYQIPLTINNDQDSVLVDITRAHSRCSFFARYWIQIRNLSYNQFSGTLNVFIDENSQNVEPLLGGELLGSHTLNYMIEDLAIGGKLKFEATVQIPSADFLSFPLKDSYDLLNDNEDIIAMGESPYILRCAYDPNDKSIRPDRTIEYGDQYILNEELEYLIRFENVGNDSAINIKVIDTISGNLDLSTLEILSASHVYRYTLNSVTRVLTVYFDNIYLPDNKTNEPEAHGFFKFRIMPVAGLGEFTLVKNDAQIYFDFNSPILTNVVSSIFVSDLSVLKSIHLETDRAISAFPNPTNNIIYFRDGSKQNVNFSGFIYGSLGQVLMGFNNVDNVNLSSYESGIYFIKITEYGVVKVIKTE
jgi:hypothetical protein